MSNKFKNKIIMNKNRRTKKTTTCIDQLTQNFHSQTQTN